MTSSLHRTADVTRLRFSEETNAIDVEYYARLAAEGGRFVFVPTLLSEYRVHPRSETAAGLQYEKLFDQLSVIPVPSDCEETKRRFLEGIVYAIVKDRLREGDVGRARSWLANAYYPRNFRASAQRLLTRLPGGLGTLAINGYRYMCRMLPVR